jgi:hypothetical protein
MVHDRMDSAAVTSPGAGSNSHLDRMLAKSRSVSRSHVASVNQHAVAPSGPHFRPLDAPTALLPAPIPVRPVLHDWPRLLTRLALVGGWVGALTICIGLGSRAPTLVYVGTLAISGALVSVDISRARSGGITNMTVFSLVAAVTAFANIFGMAARNGPARDAFFLYAAEEHLQLAALLGLSMAVLPVLGFWAAQYHPWGRFLGDFVPRISSKFSPRSLVIVGVPLALTVSTVYALQPYGVRGTAGFS